MSDNSLRAKVSLCNKFETYFSVGVAVESKYLDIYSPTIKQHFSTITPENAFKFENIHPNVHKFDFEEADLLVEYAKENKMPVRGHTLIWHEQLPDWVKKRLTNETNPNNAWDIVEEHVSSILDRYKNDVYCWDVVNEVISDDGKGIRDTIWRKALGEDYIEGVFQIARNVIPNGKFFINEYNGHIYDKRESMKKLLDKLSLNGVTVDGVGIQGHYNITFPTIEMIEDELKFYSSYGIKVHVTELDISVFDYFDRRSNVKKPTIEMVKKQEEMYVRLFELYRKYSNVVENVTIWGVSDKTTWLNDFPVYNRRDWPLLFDSELKPKNVMNIIMNI